ncbi:ABC transporter permease [Micromonospora andamanensis]|uniref:Transport permease protein n=1 Tax=Micromonospora andamanensis TaxID=1287068 RepID=A0ABQ4HTH2_9ACTN|nr:ABC transporter permease [Micromonospora andamanensis]GIJ08958.1 transport permease protein [Micromonospora andamanensis]
MATTAVVRSRAVFEYHLACYRQTWRGTLASSFLTPVLFLLGLGVVLGGYVDRTPVLGLPYAEFVAPGLLAHTAMQVAMMDSATPVMNNFRWQRMYHVIAAAPPGPSDLVLGHLVYAALRVLAATVAFLVVMVVFGTVSSWGALLAPLVGLLVGLATAAPMCAFSATAEDPGVMAMVNRFVLLPMMLFAGIFFPVGEIPGVLQPLIFATPLWHGVELARAATAAAGTAWPVPVHVGYLLLWAVGGFLLARRQFAERLGA